MVKSHPKGQHLQCTLAPHDSILIQKKECHPLKLPHHSLIKVFLEAPWPIPPLQNLRSGGSHPSVVWMRQGSTGASFLPGTPRSWKESLSILSSGKEMPPQPEQGCKSAFPLQYIHMEWSLFMRGKERIKKSYDVQEELIYRIANFRLSFSWGHDRWPWINPKVFLPPIASGQILWQVRKTSTYHEL